MRAGGVVELWRHPVKSMAGERVRELDLEADGVVGDRRWGVRHLERDVILTAKGEPRLLNAAARLLGGAEAADVEVRLPDGRTFRAGDPAADAALTDWLGAPVRLERAAPAATATYEAPSDPEDDGSAPSRWASPRGRLVDGAPVHLVTTASLAAGAAAHPAGRWDVRRFRPNVLVEAPGDGYVEDAWLGSELAVGAVVVAPRARTRRCSMVTRSQGDLPHDLDVLRALRRGHGADLGVYATVVRPGTVRVGDPVEVARAVAEHGRA